MKNLLKTIGIILLVVAVGFGCSNQGGGGSRGDTSGDSKTKDKNKLGNTSSEFNDVGNDQVDRSKTDGNGDYIVEVFPGNGSGDGDNNKKDNDISDSTGGKGNGGNGSDSGDRNGLGQGPNTDFGNGGNGGNPADTTSSGGSGGGGSTNGKEAGTKDENGNTIGSGDNGPGSTSAGDNGGNQGGGNGYGSDPNSPNSDLLPIVMVYIPGGTGQIGDGSIWDNPAKTVTVEPFFIGKYELTQEQFYMVTGKNPSQYRHQKNLPVETVTFYYAAAFCNWLTMADMGEEHVVYTFSGTDGTHVTADNTKKGYRLATEIEWEWACRAGGASFNSTWNTGSSISLNQANYGSALNLAGAKGKTVPVAAYASSRNGLYNMHGNVSEWAFGFNVYDLPRQSRGGQYEQHTDWLRTSARNSIADQNLNTSKGPGYGIRLARSAF